MRPKGWGQFLTAVKPSGRFFAGLIPRHILTLEQINNAVSRAPRDAWAPVDRRFRQDDQDGLRNVGRSAGFRPDAVASREHPL